ncbi:response regulator transcription factor [Stutzerimonas kirkiae]|uniref:DNA-binding response regulator n=1 Tax=Stutzerimonas kirkiae TaxID=2211392 RepID=A0A4Q9QXC4_9GAMM|nr:response regulator transcription factor [Stutzerimonas kirkiae]TBU89060.1 DNA-binding response regulator [Stutzerimonas kirkiae]TBU99401.1 DNA-binding response regulator [Stutzerimonas kirkiae]TBV03866.1 DNA-binding response regulator [Stutzerimonas kirkiae]TBV14878.1 DNA-binding response regulator [Stutzerimonas kirkiae]
MKPSMESREPYKLLIVDNEPLILEELEEFFNDHALSCTICNSPQEAIQRFEEDREINIVLSDLYMPGMTGIEMIASLRASAGKRIFESILLSGQSDKQDIIMALQSGVSDYLAKPLDLDAALASINRLRGVIEQRREAMELESIFKRLQSISSSLEEVYQEISQVKKPGQPHEPTVRMAGNGDSAALDKLSPRQLEVARLIARGLSNYQISHELTLSENTVKLYVSQILRITRLHNRTQLALALAPREYP